MCDHEVCRRLRRLVLFLTVAVGLGCIDPVLHPAKQEPPGLDGRLITRVTLIEDGS